MHLTHKTTRHAVGGGAPAAGRYLAAGSALVPIMGAVVRLGRSNGTWHNGQRVARAVLRDGDTIVLGATELGYVEVVETATDPLELIAA